MQINGTIIILRAIRNKTLKIVHFWVVSGDRPSQTNYISVYPFNGQCLKTVCVSLNRFKKILTALSTNVYKTKYQERHLGYLWTAKGLNEFAWSWIKGGSRSFYCTFEQLHTSLVKFCAHIRMHCNIYNQYWTR